MRLLDLVLARYQALPSPGPSLVAPLVLLLASGGTTLQAQVPGVVFSQANGGQGISSQANPPMGVNYGGTTGHLAANSRGDVFANVSANGGAYAMEIQAGTGTQIPLLVNEGGLYGGHPIAVDKSGNVYIGDTGDAEVYFIPFVNNGYPANGDRNTLSGMPCAAFPVPATQTTACRVPLGYPASIGYYGQTGDLGLDAAGDLFILFKYTGGGSLYPNADVLVEYSGTTGNATVIDGTIQNDANGEIAVNPAGDVFVDTYGSVFEYPHTSYGSKIGVPNLSGPNGVSVDANGNLFITNNNNGSNGSILEYPFVNGTYGLPGSPVSIVSNQLATGYSGDAANGVAIDGFGKITMSGNYPNSISTLTSGHLAFGATPINTSSGTSTLNMVFNNAATFGNFTVTGPFAVSTAALPSGDTACTAQSYLHGGNCSVNLIFSPTAAGTQLGEIVAYDNQGDILGTAALSGTGTAPVLNVDPGTNSTLGSGFQSPAGIATDVAGNIYVADTTTGNIYKTLAGTTSATAIASGFNSPSGLAVDGEGNLYVADSGNSQLVEVPYLPATSTYGPHAVLLTGLSGPSGLAVDALGNLYVADSNNARVLRLASSGDLPIGSIVTTFGGGWTKPVAVAVDSTNGFVYVADASAGTVVQVNPVTTTANTVLSGLTAASGITVDPAGSLYAVDSGAQSIRRLPFIAGGLNQNFETTLSQIVAKPNQIATDSIGNLYVSDASDATVVMDSRSAGLLSFGIVDDGDTSPVIAAEISNGGTAALMLAGSYYTQSGSTSAFAVQGSSTCANAMALTQGQSCTLAADFSPQAPGGVLTELLSFASVASNTASLTFTGTGLAPRTPTAVAVSVTSPAGTPSYGQAVTLQATLTEQSNTQGAPTGGVTFYIDSVAQSQNPLPLTNGTATITIPVLTGGSHSVTASYTGDVHYASSTSPAVTVTIGQSTSSTTVSISAPDTNPTAANPSQPVTLTATVAAPITGVPTGTVTFYNGTTSLGTAPLVNLTSSSSSATLVINPTTAPLTLGQYSITASYAGDSNFLKSASTASPLLIANSTVTLSASATTVTGNGAAIQVTVSAIAGFTGAVDFSCSNLPQYAACSFAPTYAVVAPAAPATVSFTVLINQPPPIAVPGAAGISFGHPQGTGWLLVVAGCLLPMLLLGWIAPSRRKSLGRWALTANLMLVAVFGLALIGLTGCGSSTTAAFDTPKGTSTVTVNAFITQETQAPLGGTVTPTSTVTPAATLPIQLTVQ
jgi:sugar lactone lactonase YvrE